MMGFESGLAAFFGISEFIVIIYFVVANTFYAILLVSAFMELRDHTHRVRGENRMRILGSKLAPKVSLLAPAYNESATIAESVQSLLALFYPDLELIVINDGSSDNTLDVMKRTFDLVRVHTVYQQRIKTKRVKGLYRSRSHPGLLVVDKVNGRKADALNVGLNVASGDLVCAMDADTLIEPDALQRIVRPFLESEHVLAAGGTLRVANSCEVLDGQVRKVNVPRQPIPGFQVCEYLRAFLFGRLGWNKLGGNLVISGAFGLFRKDSVLEAGGYLHDTVGEDIELVFRLREIAYREGRPHKVAFIPDPVAWTEVPSSLRVLGRQRDRWHRGLSDVSVRYRRVLFNPRYGWLGMVVFPYFFFIELMAPLVEALGLIGLAIGIPFGLVNWPFAVLFFLTAYGYGMILNLSTLLLEEFSFQRYSSMRDRLLLILWSMLENFGYRQLSVIWRLNGMWKYFRGNKEWGVMERTGLTSTPTS
jgi:cellulose synthase/poly-beta-1,6-N-acetylglucosamine synthase-like glycosyltransferase